ncbi:efflux RND transporter periplasmic adaptor subunit [Methylosarcina fibrata]|uniref:efflux RND transporter periplasmic adaptor subunit n=1 Tax=Methylosarcina fibrata TaxID=105972 RepID=UPI001E62EE10|nr:efflux RND transporter periplasmic adaptor subunit [Methylosarcina fibrata]
MPALCLFLAACSSKNETDSVDTHQVITPIVKDIVYSSEYVAEIHSIRNVEIRSKVRGYIEKNHVDEGQPVKKGQPLFDLSTSEFEKELQKADAVYKNAIADLKASEVELDNVKLLVAKNIVSGAELRVAQAKSEALRADVEEARANKDKTALHISFAHIKAPFDGVINRIPNKVGSLIQEGDMLTTISDNREVFAYFNLSEIDYLNYIVAENNKIKNVSLRLANNALYRHEGKIEAIESEFDPSTGNIAFRARFPNPEAILKHGANGKIIVKKHLKKAMLVPQKSTFEIQDKLYVFVVNPENVLKQRNIIPQMRFQEFYVVESGLSESELILFEGAETMKDGAKIQPEPVEPAKAMPLNSKD